jgi:DNA-binding XRE family transcriptional regulator
MAQGIQQTWLRTRLRHGNGPVLGASGNLYVLCHRGCGALVSQYSIPASGTCGTCSAGSRPSTGTRTRTPTGGQEAFDAAVTAMLDDARGWRLAEMRKRRGMTQEQVAVRMGASVARVSLIEGGDVYPQDVLSRFAAALGGTLKLIADFGDEQLKLA